MCLHHWEKLQVAYKAKRGSKAPPKAGESPNFLQQEQETSSGLWWAEQFITVCTTRKKSCELAHFISLISCKDYENSALVKYNRKAMVGSTHGRIRQRRKHSPRWLGRVYFQHFQGHQPCWQPVCLPWAAAAFLPFKPSVQLVVTYVPVSWCRCRWVPGIPRAFPAGSPGSASCRSCKTPGSCLLLLWFRDPEEQGEMSLIKCWRMRGKYSMRQGKEKHKVKWP